MQGSTSSSTGVFLFCSPIVRPVSEKRRRTRVMGRKMRSRKTMRESLNWGLKMKERKPRKAAPLQHENGVRYRRSTLGPTMTGWPWILHRD